MDPECLVVNLVIVDESEVTVGATNRTRWRWDVEDGQSGVDARTLVWVTLKDNGAGFTVGETAGLCCDRADPLRALALRGIEPLLAIAWSIRERGASQSTARADHFGTFLLERP